MTAIGSGARRSAVATLPGSSSAATAPAATRRSASPAPAGTTGINPAATAHQNACGSSSASSRLTHTPFRPSFPAHSHDPAKIVLPQPAAAATTVTGAPDGAVTSGCRRARETTSVTTGDENFSGEYPPTVGLAPADGPRSPCALQDRPCARGAEPGATMGNEYTYPVRGRISPDIRAALQPLRSVTHGPETETSLTASSTRR